MKLLAIILAIAVTQATYSQCSDRVNGLGVNARYFVDGYADAINPSLQFNLKKHSFQAGAFLSFYQITKIQIWSVKTTSDLYSGLNLGYNFFPNAQTQTVDFFFHYNAQVGPSFPELFKGFYTLYQTVGYGFNVYLLKSKKIYLHHLFGLGLGLWRDYETDWQTNERYIKTDKFWTAFLSLGIGFNITSAEKKEEINIQ